MPPVRGKTTTFFALPPSRLLLFSPTHGQTSTARDSQIRLMGKADLVERTNRTADTVVGKLQVKDVEPNRQPSEDPNDPLNWPLWVKVRVRLARQDLATDTWQMIILTQTSLLAALGGLNTAAINPAYGQMAAEFGISTVRASYQT